ncbi:GGDEF domain-containing protein [Actinoplanes sp. NPDC023801]|uniref:GGDEF domain-containing protein n=1 Tax=Actinoplanes sp. NPDC023801 TaxID=3154595 RepID=UPI0033D8EF87
MSTQVTPASADLVRKDVRERERVNKYSRMCLVALTVSAVWFAVTVMAPVGPAWLLWVPIPVCGLVVSAAFRSVSRNRGLPGPTVAFWRRLTPVPMVVTAGQTVQAVDVLTHPGARTSYTHPLMLIFGALALLAVIHALIRLPGGGRPGSGALIALDAGSVALAAAVFGWHFGTRAALRAGTTPEVLVSLALTVLTSLTVFALAKAVMSEHSPIDKRGLRLLALAATVGALAPMLQPVVAAAGDRLFVAQLEIPLVMWFAAKAAEAQWQAVPRATVRKRPYSVLPYVAVAAVDVLLLVNAWQGSDDMVAVAFTAVALTGIVAYRQMTALRENSRLVERLDHAASHDALTGLANRALFQRRLEESLRGPGTTHVALLDLDGFKEINDTYGHEAGDLLLTRVGAALAAATGPGGTAARLGGDEFVLVLPDSTCAEAAAVAERVLAGLREPVPVGGRSLCIRASIGIAGGTTGDDPAELLRTADTTMYAAKRVPGSAYLHHEYDSAVVA